MISFQFRVFTIFFQLGKRRRQLARHYTNLPKNEFVNILQSLQNVYVEARSSNVKYYRRNSMIVICAGLERDLKKQNSNFSIITEPANDALNARLYELALVEQPENSRLKDEDHVLNNRIIQL